jgi:hypothetical protein
MEITPRQCTNRANSASRLELREVVTVPGEHLNRWRQVFEILDGALSGKEEAQDDQQARSAVREMLTRRAV